MGPTRAEIMEMIELREKKKRREAMESEWPAPSRRPLDLEGPTIEADAQHDLQSDSIVVRVRRRWIDKDGVIHKKGVVFRIQDELLCNVAPGMQYPEKKIDRFEGIVDEVE